ncbi:MAG: cheD [Limisphaerales bacterium]|nr:MAG: cheD [Limisphaerales bacterium]
MSLPNQWVIAPPPKTLIVGVADMIASNDANAELITYSLGSCLGVAVYDPVSKVGGLLHLMLPDSSISPEKAAKHPFMFADTGLPRLFHNLYSFGGVKSRLVVKVAGGAHLQGDQHVFNIGGRNVQSLRNILAQNGVTPAALDVGGHTSRTLRMRLSDGRISIQSPGMTAYTL